MKTIAAGPGVTKTPMLEEVRASAPFNKHLIAVAVKCWVRSPVTLRLVAVASMTSVTSSHAPRVYRVIGQLVTTPASSLAWIDEG